MTQISAQQRFASVRARLSELELWDADSLVMTAPGAVCSAAGEPVEAALFSAVSAPMAVLTAGGTPANFPKLLTRFAPRPTTPRRCSACACR